MTKTSTEAPAQSITVGTKVRVRSGYYKGMETLVELVGGGEKPRYYLAGIDGRSYTAGAFTII